MISVKRYGILVVKVVAFGGPSLTAQMFQLQKMTLGTLKHPGLRCGRMARGCTYAGWLSARRRAVRTAGVERRLVDEGVDGTMATGPKRRECGRGLPRDLLWAALGL